MLLLRFPPLTEGVGLGRIRVFNMRRRVFGPDKAAGGCLRSYPVFFVGLCGEVWEAIF